MAVATTPPVYRKLTPMRRGLGTMTQLWLGPDHLLHVMSTGYSESYRRFYFRDIQAILIVHTDRRTYNAAALTLFMAIIGAIVLGNGGGWWGAGIVAAIFLPFLVWNHLRGPACRGVILSAVQEEKIPSLHRLKKARRILAEIKPLIEAAQADLVRVATESVAAPVAVAPPVVVSSLPPPLPPPLPRA